MSTFAKALEKEREKHESQGGSVKEITFRKFNPFFFSEDKSIKMNCCVCPEGNLINQGIRQFADLTKQ